MTGKPAHPHFALKEFSRNDHSFRLEAGSSRRENRTAQRAVAAKVAPPPEGHLAVCASERDCLLSPQRIF
jgi:hypothetical protein